MPDFKRLPFADKKLLNAPYVQLLEFAVRQALADRYFTKAEACQAYPKLVKRWEGLSSSMLSAKQDDTYIIKPEIFLQYVNLVSLRDARVHAQRAHYTAIFAIGISIILLVLRLLEN